MAWSFGDARKRFDAVVERALREGPQVVTRRGAPVVVVVPVAQWRASQPGFKAALRALDLAGIELERSADVGRDVLLSPDR
jgi:antitoxin Phd